MNNYLNLSREQLLPYVGSIEQLAPVRRVAFLEGKAKSVEAVQVETGSGMAFSLLVDRALDLSSLTFNGRSLCWRSAAGVVAPAYYERKGAGWLRGFGGGMLVTCGLRNVGPGSEEGWETYGLHGEISFSPASHVATCSQWKEDRYEIEVSGDIAEAYPFGPNLKLHRTWRTQLGVTWIELEDRVTNEGYRPESHLQLYHWNFGFPLLNEKSRLFLTTSQQASRDDVAAAGLTSWQDFATPSRDFAEQVFFHSYQEAAPEITRALLISNRDETDFGVELSYLSVGLPYLVQWKLCSMGEYVLGIEPGNCLVGGRKWHDEQGLKPLQPGESRTFRLRLDILPDKPSVTAALLQFQ